MSGATFSDLESFGMLKDLYSDDVKYQEHIQSSLYNFIRKASADEVEFDGNYFNVPAQMQINESYAAINDDERLPESGTTKGVFAKYRPKFMYSVLQATQFAATRGHKNGRPNGKYLDDLMKGTLLSFLSNVDFDCYGNGRGIRATIETAVAGQASFTVVTSMKLRAGMKLDWYDSTLATKRGSIVIDKKSVDRMNKRAYIDATLLTGVVPVNAVAGDKLVVYGALAAGEPADGRHIAGLSRITDNTVALGSLSPSDWAQWMATVINASGGNPSQEILQLMFDQMYLISGMFPNKMVFNTGFKRAYLAQFLNQRRFTGNEFDTGATRLSFSPLKMGEDEKNRKPTEFRMLEDKNCDPDTTFFWHDSAFATASDYADTPHMADEDGSELRIPPGFDALAGFYRFWMNTVTFQRNAIGKIYNWAIPSGTL
jgi:hypothetical protein